MRGFRLHLTPRQRDQLRRAERSHPSPRVRWRARLLLACAKAHSLLQVAQGFDCSWSTVKAAVRRYQSGGLAALADAPRCGRPPKVQAALRQKLAQALQAQPQASGLPGYCWTAPRIQRYLARYQARASLTTAWRELRRYGRLRRRGKHYTPCNWGWTTAIFMGPKQRASRWRGCSDSSYPAMPGGCNQRTICSAG